MVDLVEMPLEGGGRILFKVSADSPVRTRTGSGPVDAGVRAPRMDDLVDQAHQSFAQVVEAIAKMSVAARDGLRTAGPDEVCLEFGVQVEAGAGVVLASVNSGCHVSVTVTWKAERDGHGG